MSEQMLGADLQQLEDLAAAFDKAGTEIAAKADTLRDKIDASVDAFVAALDGLARDASTLTSAIDTEIDGVSTQASGVQWTGGNRGAFDTDLGTFNTAVKTGTAAINTDIGDAEERRRGPLHAGPHRVRRRPEDLGRGGRHLGEGDADGRRHAAHQPRRSRQRGVDVRLTDQIPAAGPPASGGGGVPWRRSITILLVTAFVAAAVVAIARSDGFPATDALAARATHWFVHRPSGRVVLADGYDGVGLARLELESPGAPVSVADGGGGAYVLDPSTGDATADRHRRPPAGLAVTRRAARGGGPDRRRRPAGPGGREPQHLAGVRRDPGGGGDRVLRRRRPADAGRPGRHGVVGHRGGPRPHLADGRGRHGRPRCAGRRAHARRGATRRARPLRSPAADGDWSVGGRRRRRAPQRARAAATRAGGGVRVGGRRRRALVRRR